MSDRGAGTSLLAYYARQSRRPLVSLAFVAPLLVAYEVGVLIVPAAMRNGADVWLRRLLDTLGFGGYFLLPVLTVAALLAWHHTTRQPWKVPGGVLPVMLIESALFSLALVGVARLHGFVLTAIGCDPVTTQLLAVGSNGWQQLARIVAFLGAGVYEEVLFRLLLLPTAIWLIRVAGGSRRTQIVGAIVATSLLFALAHYVGRFGDSLVWSTFTFRFSAGVFFAVLFVWRGFGIAAGAHALYDIYVGAG
jgi:membrane protease YdiL (CAAX protease family)